MTASHLDLAPLPTERSPASPIPTIHQRQEELRSQPNSHLPPLSRLYTYAGPVPIPTCVCTMPILQIPISMPAPSTALRPLPRCATRAEVESCQSLMPEQEVKEILLKMATEILAYLEEPSKIFGTLDHNPYEVSLQTLFARLKGHYLPPPLVKALRKDESFVKDRVGPRSPREPLDRPLEDYEDLYYALIARIGDLHSTLTMYLTHFVPDPSISMFNSFSISMSAFHTLLYECFAVLNNIQLISALHQAIKRGRGKAIHTWYLVQLENCEITQDEFDTHMNSLYDPPPFGEIDGLEFIGGTSPAMINARLTEKYRILLDLEGHLDTKDSRWMKKQKKMAKMKRVDVRKRAKSRSREQARESLGLGRNRSGSTSSEMLRKKAEEKKIARRKSRAADEMAQMEVVLKNVVEQEEQLDRVVEAQAAHYTAQAAAQRFNQEQTMGFAVQGFGTGIDFSTSTITAGPDSRTGFVTSNFTAVTSSSPNEGPLSGSTWNSDMTVSDYPQYMQMLRGAASDGARMMVDGVHHAVRQTLGSSSSEGTNSVSASAQIVIGQLPMRIMEEIPEGHEVDLETQMNGAYSSAPSHYQAPVYDHAAGQDYGSMYPAYSYNMTASQTQSYWQWYGETMTHAQQNHLGGAEYKGQVAQDVGMDVEMEESNF